MPIPSIYINLEDDVSKIVTRIKREKAEQLVLVCPKRCFLFNDSINLRLLKKQVDLLGREVFILTMDERGQLYAKEAGFGLKTLPRPKSPSAVSDVRPTHPISTQIAKKPAAASKVAVKHSEPIKHTEKSHESKVHRAAPKVEVTHKTVYKDAPGEDTSDLIFDEEQLPFTNQEETAKKRSHFYGRFLTGLVALSLVIILVLVFVVLPRASVVVYPKTEPITRDMEITISSQTQQPNPDALQLPGTPVSDTVEVSGKYDSQGKKQVGNRALGTVQIYNFTRAPLNLKASTTTFTVGSKTYVLTEDVSGIRPTAYKNPYTKEVDEATLSEPVEVIAQQGGEDSNVPAGTRMEISNQVFGSKPQFLFAKTATAVTGGTTRYLSVVSEQDIASSQAALGQKLLNELNDKLAGQNLSFAQKSYMLEPLSFTTDKAAGAESPSFTATLKAKVTGLAFNQDELKKLISDRIGSTLSADKVLESSPDPINYKLKSIDLNQNLAVITVHYESKAVYDLDLGDIKSQLVGKSRQQANEILKSNQQIEQIDITIAPSWQNSFPWFAREIEVRVEK